jgi:hypothetical protein
LQVDGAAGDVIKLRNGASNHALRLSDYEWTGIKPMLPNRPRGVRDVRQTGINPNLAAR